MSRVVRTPTVPFDLQASVYILIAASSELQTVITTRCKDGSQNGNVKNGWELRFRNRLVKEAGCDYNDAFYMINDLYRNKAGLPPLTRPVKQEA